MIINPYSFGVAYDPDAQAFFTASGLTGATNLTAINNLVVALKGYGIWTKMKAIYPFIGGTAALHKWNLKNPLDTNAAFRLVFNGGWTHSSTGATPNGTNGYADTNLNMSTNYSVNDNTHISFYSRTSIATNASTEMGVFDNTNGTLLYIRRSDQSNNTFYNVNSPASLIFVDSNAAAFYISNRLGTTMNGFRNLVKTVTGTSAAGTRPNLNMWISNLNFPLNPNFYSPKQVAFASIGDGLTDTEANNFYTAVQAYQTTLSRQV